eukprot:4805947-Amphidinium_carterae.1
MSSAILVLLLIACAPFASIFRRPHLWQRQAFPHESTWWGSPRSPFTMGVCALRRSPDDFLQMVRPLVQAGVLAWASL